MAKSTFAIIIMGIVMVAMLAFGGTFAYFTATANNKNAKVTTGVIKLTSGEVATVTGTVVDKQNVLGKVEIDSTGTTVDSFVFVTLKSSVTKAAGAKETPQWSDLFGEKLTVSGESVWTKLKDLDNGEGTVYYRYVTSATADKQEFISALTINCSSSWVEGQDQPKEMGATVVVTISAKAIQAYSFGDGTNSAANAGLAYAQI